MKNCVSIIFSTKLEANKLTRISILLFLKMEVKAKFIFIDKQICKRDIMIQ